MPDPAYPKGIFIIIKMKMKSISFIVITFAATFLLLSDICHSAIIVDINSTASGWVKHNGETNGTNSSTTNFIAGRNEPNGLTNSNFFVFDVSGVEGEIISATLQLQNPYDGFYSYNNDYFGTSDFYTYTITRLNDDAITASDLLAQNWSYPYTGIGAWSIINNGMPVNYGDVPVNESSNGTTVEIPLNSFAISDLNTFLDSPTENYYALGGRLINETTLEAYVFSNTGYNLYSRVLSLEIEDSSAVPIPGSVWFLGPVFAILVGIRKKYNRP